MNALPATQRQSLRVRTPVEVAFAIERDLLARAKRERAGLRVVWEQARDSIPARWQARLARELAKIKPVLIQKDGSRVLCEQPFRLTRPERRELAAEMLREGASRSEILAADLISPATLLSVKRAISPNGARKPHSHAVQNVVSENGARVDGNGEKVAPYLPPDRRGPAPIALDALGMDLVAEERFRALMTDGEPVRQRPHWHRWVYGAASNPLHDKRVLR